MIKTDNVAYNFKLKNEINKDITLSDFKGKIVVLEWFNKDCPFVKKHYETNNMQKLQETYIKKGIVWLSIISSAPGKQGHISSTEASSLIKNKKTMANHILFDSDGSVGRKYAAKTTPHMYIINKKGILVYQGAIDSIPSANKEDVSKAKNFVKTNLDNLLTGKKISLKETKAYGCSVKY